MHADNSSARTAPKPSVLKSRPGYSFQSEGLTGTRSAGFENASKPNGEFNANCMEVQPVRPSTNTLTSDESLADASTAGKETGEALMSDERLAAASTVGKETDRRNEEFLGVQKRPEEGGEQKDEDFENMMKDGCVRRPT